MYEYEREHEHMYIYIYIYIYIYGTPPPKIHVFTLCSALLTCQHLLTIILSFSHSHFFYYHRGEVHIEILGHIEFQYGGSKIQDCTGLLGRYLGSGRSILKYWATLSFNMADPRSKIQDCTGLLGRNLGSWILYIDIQYGLNISI